MLFDLGPYGEGYSNILKITAVPYTKFYSSLINGGNNILEQQITVPGITNPNWVYQYIFYDAEGNIIQERSNNHLSLARDNLTTTVFDFEGKLKIKKTYHYAGPGKITTVLNKYEYDHAGRLLRIYQNNNASTNQLLVENEYNELGQLVDKKLHKKAGNNFLQSIDYRYSIQGWLTSINNAELTDDGISNDDTNDYFGMEFLYQNTEAGLISSNEVNYDGNISAVKWKGAGTASGTEDQSSYKYSYDKANRLRSAISQKNTGTSWSKEEGAVNEQMTYDLNGNIMNLQRNMRLNELDVEDGLPVISTVTETMDNLTYSYSTTNGDRLLKVVDATSDKTGFDNGESGSANDYSYDGNGNLKSDLNKGISNITYNLLGKADLIEFSDGRKIEYVYDAAGTKLSMSAYASKGNTPLMTTDYVDGFVYKNNILSFFASPDGRVSNHDGVLEYQYAITDQQGNTRVLFGSGTPAPSVVTATFEGNSSDDSDLFQNIDICNVVPSVAANHTSPGSKVVRMNQSYSVGLSKSLSVAPGDKVDLEVYAYYENSSGYGTTGKPLAIMAALVADGFGGTSGGQERAE